MGSIVLELQQDILGSKKSVTEILRTAKVISTELELMDISAWIELELVGYNNTQVPKYRTIEGGDLQYFNPYSGWHFAGHINRQIPISEPIAGIEELAKLAKDDQISLKISKNFPLSGDGFAKDWPQRLVVSNKPYKTIIEAVKDQVLNWTIELKKRGIVGENITFNESERRSAKKEPFHIQQNITVHGDWNQSTLQVHNFGSIYQTLRDFGIPKDERDELEAIMDELKAAEPSKKPSLLERGEKWVVKHEKFLGASASIIRKALGSGEG